MYFSGLSKFLVDVKMSEKITITELEEMTKGFGKYINNPKNSHRAGDMYILIKKINKVLKDKLNED